MNGKGILRRVSLLSVSVVILLVGASPARAQTATASGVVDWSAFTSFTVKGAEVVLIDVSTGNRVVVTPTPSGPTTATFSVALKVGDEYAASAVVGNCAGDPAACGTATAGGTHIRFASQFVPAPADSSPVTLNFIADSSLNPVALCGSIQVDSGTFIKLSAALQTGIPDEDGAVGVFSTALVAAPAASYCVEAAPFSAPQLDSTITIGQTQLPTCPARVDVQRVDFLFFGTDPLTDDIHIVVPPPPGAITGTFSVGGFSADSVFVSASTSGITVAPCAGLTSFSASGGAGPLSFDFTPALAGPWAVSGEASSVRNTADGLLQVSRLTEATIGDASAVTVNVAAGKKAVASLSYNAAVVSGNVSVDARRWGGPVGELSPIPSLEGMTQADALGAGWFPSKFVLLPMQVAERYDVALDPRGDHWVLVGVEGVGYQYQFPVVNGSATSGFSGVVAMPNFRGNQPFDQFQMPSLPLGSLPAGARITVDLPALDFHVASVTLNPAADGPALFWFTNTDGQYALPNGVLFTPLTSLQAASFDGGAPVGRALFPPGRYDGETDSVDPDFNDSLDPRSFDLEPDDDLTSDFGAPMLLGVRPAPGAAGGAATVTGTVVTSDSTVKVLHVLVNGAAATVKAGGAFSARAVIGTGPLTVVARDNLGRTTTLKRYFTTITGLFSPLEGAYLVSQNEDINAVTNFGLFLPALAKGTFKAGRTIPLNLAGALGPVVVTNANTSAPPRVVGLVKVAQGLSPTPVTPPGQTVFKFDGGQWVGNFSTKGLSAGTYVVQIQFWDGRILEAALVLT